MRATFAATCALAALLEGLAHSSLAQNTTSTVPWVTIRAPDPQASEAGPDPGVFTVQRWGPTNLALLVFYSIHGSASNGMDYESLASPVPIPAGATQAVLAVQPLDDALAEPTESVAIHLQPSPLMGPMETYRIGSPSNAVVFIADNDSPATNAAPFVRLNEPADGTVFRAPADVLLQAYAQDHEDGYDLAVEFSEGTNSLGLGTFVPTLCPAPYCPFFALHWSNVPPGYYTLTAKVTDKGGASAVSDPVRILVEPLNVLPVVNLTATDPVATEIPLVPPDMERPQLMDPAVFTVTRAGPTNTDLAIYYSVGGTASNGVDYERLTGLVTIPAGAGSALLEVEPIDDLLVEGPETVVLTLQPVACAAVIPPPPGCYLVGLSNRATAFIHDNDVTTSNLPPVVSIVATDPFAAEGAFTWRTNVLWPSNSEVPPGGVWGLNVCCWTNLYCGTNTATFQVRRSSATNTDLTVHYLVGGRASNGVDYVALPGTVTIPTGSRAAAVRIIPIDDALVEGPESVVLQLIWPLNAAINVPPYALGRPQRAAAVVADNEWPRLPSICLPDGLFHLFRPATNGFGFRIECTTDFRTWEPVCTNVVADGALHFVDPDADELNCRFYRVVPDPAATTAD